MKDKQKLFLKSSMLLFLFFFVGALIVVEPLVMHAAPSRVEPSGFIKFANLGIDKLSGSPGYLKLDVNTYGINMTTNGGLAQRKGNNKYDVITTSAASRIAYQRKLEVAYGTTISLAGGVADIGIGGADVPVEKIAWNVMEWDENGFVVSDSGWLYTDQTYIVGKSPDKTDWSTSDYWGPMDRKTVKYITLIFRYLVPDDSMGEGTGMQNSITVAEFTNVFPNVYLCYSPFTYTVKNTSGTTLTTLSRLGTERFSLDSYVLPAKTGYTAGFKITSDSSIEPNWMNGNTYPATQVNSWLENGRFYNSLFGNVTFTQAYIPHAYPVTYDYWTNGGRDASKHTANVDYGTAIDLSVTATKNNGYTFVGWNTNPAATEGLTSLIMSTTPVTLYAIYEKVIEVTLTETTDAGTVTTCLSQTIYNNTKYADFVIAEKGHLSGWKNIGWSNRTEANATAVTSTGATYTTCDSIVLYALYAKAITISYDTNGSQTKLDSETKTAYHNASQNTIYPVFDIAKGPIILDHTFDVWVGENGAVYKENSKAMIRETTVLTAKWDKYPVIEAKDRYFTLEEAMCGLITQKALLSKVIATDKEDGVLKNGIAVVVKEYNPAVFTAIKGDAKLEVTYQATDSFGNVVRKTQSIFITDTSMKKRIKQYVRFISADFFADGDGNLLLKEAGGLENTSIWRRSDSYRTLLRKTLLGENTDAEIYIFTAEDLKKRK